VNGAVIFTVTTTLLAEDTSFSYFRSKAKQFIAALGSQAVNAASATSFKDASPSVELPTIPKPRTLVSRLHFRIQLLGSSHKPFEV
jgi:hypothetical protein